MKNQLQHLFTDLEEIVQAERTEIELMRHLTENTSIIVRRIREDFANKIHTLITKHSDPITPYAQQPETHTPSEANNT